MKNKLTASEKLRILLARQGRTLADLADITNQSRQNLSNKMGRDKFNVCELMEYANALGADFEFYFILPDGTKL